jgi:hypothetical protein
VVIQQNGSVALAAANLHGPGFWRTGKRKQASRSRADAVVFWFHRIIVDVEIRDEYKETESTDSP